MPDSVIIPDTIDKKHIIHKLLELNKLLTTIDSKYTEFTQLSVRTERQAHGFKYEKLVIEKYNLQKSKKYQSEFDGYTKCKDKIPVSIKYIKQNSEVSLSSFKRNANITQDFILHIAFHTGSEKICSGEEYTLYINHVKFVELVKKNDFKKIRDDITRIKKTSTYAEYKNYIKHYNDSNNVICIRYKSPNKSKKRPERYQAGIPYSKLQEFVAMFTPYKFNPVDTALSTETRKKLEKFYTKKSVVKLCMEHVKWALGGLNIENPHVLEPAAGSGVFIDEFGEFTYDAYDIHPEGPNIKKADFLIKNNTEIITREHDNLVVIGNPPYKLAIKFIKKCADLNAVLICFVLPNVFKKPTIINKVDSSYHLMKQIQLPKNSFELGNVDYDVPSSFFIFVKKNKPRPLIKLNIDCVGYKYIPFTNLTITNGVILNADISIVRVGGRAGMAFSTDDISDDALVSKQKYNYFIKIIDAVDNNSNIKTIRTIINEINETVWDKNNTTGPRSIGKYELNPILNEILSF